MEKITSFMYGSDLVEKVNCKSIKEDSEQQKILTVDLYKKVNDEFELVGSSNKAFILGNQPFELTDEEIAELSK